MSRRAAVVLGIAIAAACTPIRPVPLSSAPVNTCPCDAYDASQSRTAPRCQNSRCEISTAGNRPEFPFWIVVDVPNTSIYAPSSTYVLFSDEKGAPTFTRKAPAGTVSHCQAPLCVQLGGLTGASGSYAVSAAVSLRARYPLDDGAKIPVRVEYEPVGNDAQEPTFPVLPLEPTFVFPQLTTAGAEFAQALPSGLYARTFYPEPPFDALFPPRSDAAQQVGTPTDPSSNFVDPFVLDAKSLDPDVGRTVTVNRDEGLDGWHVSIVDTPSQRRISTVKTLTGTSQTVQLDTTGQQRTPGGGLGDNVEVVVAPPDGYIAVPTFVTSVFGGQQFEIDYPFVSSPVAVQGVVAEPTPVTGAQLLGYSARVTFESANIATPRAAQPTSLLLHYATNLSTDDRGQFATVLPPGTYNVTIEPAEGTGFAKSRQVVVVDRVVTALTLQPPLRTSVKGRVVLTDGRPLADADILALPQDSTSTSSTPTSTPKPRPGRSHTANDGRYELQLDQGPYVLTVVPQDGTGFPRVVTQTLIPADATELQDILVPPPTPLSFTVGDPTKGFENPVPHAIVRIFAVPGVSTVSELGPQNPAPVEIGMAMTDANGLVEILLAPGPR